MIIVEPKDIEAIFYIAINSALSIYSQRYKRFSFYFQFP